MMLRMPIYLATCFAVACCAALWSEAAQRREAPVVAESARMLAPLRSLRGHREQITGLTYSRDGRRLASTSEDGTVRVWAVASGRCLGTLRRPARRVLFLRDSDVLLVGDYLWRLSFGHGAGAVTRTQGPLDPLALSPDGKLLLASGRGAFQVWRTDRWKVVRTVPVPRAADEAGRTVFIQSAGFSPLGSAVSLVTSSINRGDPPVPVVRVTLWDTATWRVRRVLMDNGFETGADAAFSPDGRRLAIGTDGMGSTGEVAVWDLAAGRKQILVPEGEGNEGMAWVNGGRWLASGGDPGTVSLLDAKNGQPVARLPHHNGVTTFAAAPDGRTMATGDGEGVIRLWAVPSTLAPSKGHPGHAAEASAGR